MKTEYDRFIDYLAELIIKQAKREAEQKAKEQQKAS